MKRQEISTEIKAVKNETNENSIMKSMVSEIKSPQDQGRGDEDDRGDRELEINQ